MSGGDRALVSLSIAQKIWEVDVKSGEVLWEYICVDPQQHRRRRIQTAQYVPEVNFPLNRGSEDTPASVMAAGSPARAAGPAATSKTR
jgi:hypothetical protein